MAATDIDLLSRWAGGDRSAGDLLFSRHFRSVFRFFRNKTDAECEELTQRTFLRCMEARDRFLQAATFRTFLFAIARNVLREYFREQKRSNERIEFGATSVTDLGVSAGTVIATSEEQRMLLTALRQLPVDRQLLIELYYWEEMSIAELADVFSSPAGTVKRWLWQARKRLAEILETLDATSARSSSIESLDEWARSLRAPVGSDEGRGS